jgi:glycosyltransferase involved in cell wall biosynthesis
MRSVGTLTGIRDYERYIGAETVDRILEKALALAGQRVVHVNSTYYGGGVAEILDPLSLLMNALQRAAAVVLQKSLREGFGLTVTEAMWKGTPVIGGNVGGIPLQIRDGHNGFLVSSVDEAADRIVTLLKDSMLREQMGRRARESVMQQFLLSRLLEQYLDLLAAFEVRFHLRAQ